MVEVFPRVKTVLLADAPKGSILRIPRSQGAIFALVTDQIVNNVKSVVMLNAQMPNNPRVLFAQGWRLDEPYLCYDKNIRFELSMDEDSVDDQGHEWWRIPGVIVSVGDQLLIRAGNSTNFGFGNSYVDIQTGAVFTGEMPNGMFSFGAWKLLVIDFESKRSFELCSIKIPKNKQQ